MWKDFLFYNKSQRLAIIVLLVLIVVTVLAACLMPYLFRIEKENVDEQYMKEVNNFRASLTEKENKNSFSREFDPFEPRSKSSYPVDWKYELFSFDPNTIDSAAFARLGLKSYVVRNILKYRAKGGKFKTPESFARIYGISEEKFEELKPYIHIKQSETVSEESTVKKEWAEEDFNTDTPSLEATPIAVDINSADTAQLKTVKGIGTVLSNRIVAYRKKLGGFYSVNQLKEVYGMTDENFERIISQIQINPSDVRKIDINKASIERLKNHPYIYTFQRAKAIYEYRRRKVKLNSSSQLKHLEEFSEDDWVKLEPYLSFE